MATTSQISKPAIVLLSGGLDSATVLAMAIRDGFRPFAMSFRYGQRHQSELDRANQIVATQNVVEHIIVDIDLGIFGGSALTDDRLVVPKGDTIEAIGKQIPITYVPARNTVFLSFALAWAEVVGARDIFIGVNALDYSGYPDCRPEYISAYERMANLATKVGAEYSSTGLGEPIRIRTPLIAMTKAEIIRTGLDLGVDYSLTFSCYDPVDGQFACGHCDACLLRLRGFEQNGIPDPTCYATS
ncbi:MAG: 7-cyano-7-deazaguanine synthase QueC [Pirellulaceae bacterium]|nr:7-cyano-7-deazaguanine synthase QueC [Pirellulaceae bacterium]